VSTIPARIELGVPGTQRLALGARHSLSLPVDRVVGEVVPSIRLGLQAHVGAHWALQPHSALELAANQDLDVHDLASSRWSPGSRPLAANAVGIGAVCSAAAATAAVVSRFVIS
jgi:hypothetical protein